MLQVTTSIFIEETEGGDVIPEAEIGGMWPRAKEAGGSQEQTLVEPTGGAWPC